MTKTTPGFTLEEINAAYANGHPLAAVKMLRAETGCDINEAIGALRGGAPLTELPDFKMMRVRRRTAYHGHALYETLGPILANLETMLDKNTGDSTSIMVKVGDLRAAKRVVETIERD